MQFNIHFSIPRKKEVKVGRFKAIQISKDSAVRICSYCSELLKRNNVHIMTAKKLNDEDEQDNPKEKNKVNIEENIKNYYEK
jgi:hypothetical protein